MVCHALSRYHGATSFLTVTGEQQLPSSYNFPCGVVAGVLASVTTQPADVVKTRMQLQPQAYPSVVSTIAVVVRNNGLRGLLVGLAPRATRRTLMAAFTWAFYEEVSERGTCVCISKETSWLHNQ